MNIRRTDGPGRHRGAFAGLTLLAFGAMIAADLRADDKIDFAHDVAPILQKKCAKCHTGTQKKGGLSLNTRQSLLTGGDSGPAVVLRKSAESELIERVSSSDAELRMPPEGERLTRAQIDLLRRWIDLDLPWDDGFAFGKATRQAPLRPRRPRVPDVAGLTNPVDRFLHGYFSHHKVPAGDVVSDSVFARRVSFDLVGLPPTPDQLAALEADSQSGRRERFVDRLLSDRAAYTAHWLTFWNDLLRNAYHGTGFIDGGRQQITGWLYAAIYDTKPYDRFVHELISPLPSRDGGSEGFTFGIRWRGTVNESQRREIQAAQSVAQVFLGTNLKCASCHDSFVNHWKLTEAYALASVFADGPLELHRCDQPTGVASTVGFLYPQLGTIDSHLPLTDRARQLADLMTHPENGRLARTIVNRLWAKLFGRGLVEPLDNMDAEPWHQDLLDFLAADLADRGYDLKWTLRLMATSRAYQLPGVGLDPAAASDGFVFRGPIVKRLSAEQFVDAVLALTSSWPSADAGGMKVDGRGQGGQLRAIAGVLQNRATADETTGAGRPPGIDRQPLKDSKWLWSRPEARQAAPPETIYLRRVWTLEQAPAQAIATFTADNSFELFINGKPVAKSDNWTTPVQIDLTRFFAAGKNTVAVKATNGAEAPNPAGLIGKIEARGVDGKQVALLTTDDSWRVAKAVAADWLKPEFDDSSWQPASVLGDAAAAPWNVAEILERTGATVQLNVTLPAGFRIRAALLPLDSLQAALGRPNREQIVSARDSAPTMLQALELTNGNLLGQYLARGAEFWQKQATGDVNLLVDRIYETALGRSPTAAEFRLAAEIVGTPMTAEGIEDLLWSICMLPEFQLVP